MQAPKTRRSEPPSGTRKPQVEHCAGAASAIGARGPVLAGVPAVDGVVAARATTGPAARPRPSSQIATRSVSSSASRTVVLILGRRGVAGLEPVVVGVGRQQVADAEVAGGQPLRPRHPLLGEHRLVAGQQHRLGDRGDLPAGHPGDGDGPLPAAVRRVGGREAVGDDPLGLEVGAEVLADVLGAGRDLDGGCPRQVDGAGQDRVGGGAAERGGGHERRFSPIGGRSGHRPARPGGRNPAGWVRGADAAGEVRGGIPRRRPAYQVRCDAVRTRRTPGHPRQGRRRVRPRQADRAARASTPPATRWSRSRWPTRCSSRCPPARPAAGSRSTCSSPWRRSQ